MLVELSLPFADVRATDLTLVLGRAPEPALETLRVRTGGIDVELRLLGSSHQALVEGGALMSETVSCSPGVPGGLPGACELKLPGGGRYRFGAVVQELSAQAYREAAREAIAVAENDPDGLVGLFPGLPDAFTALHVEGRHGGAAWRTWHGYPQTGELVMTESELWRGR